MENKKTTKDTENETLRDDIKLLYDFQMKVVTESINNVVKGLPLYLTILAVVIAYFFSSKVSIENQKFIVVVGVIASISLVISCALIGRTVLNGINLISKTLHRNNSEIYQELEIGEFVSKMKRSILISLTLVAVFVLVIILGLILYIRK
jgi:hypothetical protein